MIELRVQSREKQTNKFGGGGGCRRRERDIVEESGGSRGGEGDEGRGQELSSRSISRSRVEP